VEHLHCMRVRTSVRQLTFLATLLLPSVLQAQTAPPQAQVELTHALLGDWTGVLEYRDYSEPPASLKRVELPTWLTISTAPEGLYLDYTYDDGPSKTVSEHSVVVLDLRSAFYNIVGEESVIESLKIDGVGGLKDGHGVLTLTGSITENGHPADVRTTWTIRRNLISWLEETRLAGTADPFTFRHKYTFVRTTVPKPKTSR
jgi:hypothetical protein